VKVVGVASKVPQMISCRDQPEEQGSREVKSELRVLRDYRFLLCAIKHVSTTVIGLYEEAHSSHVPQNDS
jgi:hypothetical protein